VLKPGLDIWSLKMVYYIINEDKSKKIIFTLEQAMKAARGSIGVVLLFL
jgi:hypothetical protein